jgi:hypothetical protein
MNTKSFITCKRCSQSSYRTAASLLNFGCLLCDRKKKVKGSNIFTKAFENNQNPDTYKCSLYVVEFFNENEKFIKIGVTTVSVIKRFRKTKYNVKTHLVLNLTLNEALRQEKETLKEFKEFKYTPIISFHGKQECLKFNCLENVVTALMARNSQ